MAEAGSPANNFNGPSRSRTSDSSSASSAVPDCATAYLDPNYWNERFVGEEHYEWFKDYSHFGHLIRQHVKPTDSVLELGCGNSRLCEGLYGDGIKDITCTDLSSVAVENMRARLLTASLQGINVLQADMLDLPFGDESFDVVIEKGTMDVLFVDSGDPWSPKPRTVAKVMTMLQGVHKVLKSNGTFISISFGQPHFRRPLFEADGLTWSVKWSTFGEGFHYFFYILKKGTKSFDDEGCCQRSLDFPPINLLQEELEDEDYIFRTTVGELED